MTPEVILENPIEPILAPAVPSTAGMTTKVVKGSIWTLGGAVLPLAVSFFSTPFIIRYLGSETYGVLLLVGLIPTYFSFADLGMGVASTRFASEAYGRGDHKIEGEIVRGAALIALTGSMLFAVPIILFAPAIIEQFGISPDLRQTASTALRITTSAFVLGVIASVLNTPMLSRLRMDLNTVTSTIPKLLIGLGTPALLYVGGGVLSAVAMAFLAALAGLILVFYFSARLLPDLAELTVNTKHFRPLIKFGLGCVASGIAAILLMNLEKLAISRLASVKDLAYYSVAATFAGMTTMFSLAMVQSLIPAFSQLLSAEKKAEFDRLFFRSMRLNVLWLLPVLTLMFIIARPFFTLWAGPEFGKNSTPPFYILLVGLFFNVLAFVPQTTLAASGRTDLLAKLYWLELIIYGGLVAFLVYRYGIVGAALAWSIRVILDAVAIAALSIRVVGVPLHQFRSILVALTAALSLVPAIVFASYNNFTLWLLLITPLSCAVYAAIMWKVFLDSDEVNWVKQLGLRWLSRVTFGARGI